MLRIAAPPSRSLVISKLKIERPTLDDVQRLSEGRAARSRGYGSRQVPHRLNAEERLAFNIARERGFVTLKGSGYRKERKGSPLANTYRQLSDAEGRPCILIQQLGLLDAVLVDFSPLRQLDCTRYTSAAQGLAAELGVRIDGEGTSSSSCPSPFTVIVPQDVLDDVDCRTGANGPADREEGICFEDSPAVRHVLQAPIWQQPPRLISFQCSRPVAKALGKLLVQRLPEAYYNA